MTQSEVYLDYAATSAIRPPDVVDAVAAYLRDCGATPGRSGHSRAIAASRTVFRCRMLLAELFGIEGDPGRIVFQLNATHALNTALHGLLSSGDRVVRTRYDHNAVRRPVALLVERGVREDVIGIRPDGGIDLAEVEDLFDPSRGRVKLVVLPHASNVTGVVLPVRKIADRAHEAGALVLLDAAQTAGHYPIDVEALGIDLLAFTGHKGLPGPQGTGGLWVREGVDVRPLLTGGTGGDSMSTSMPTAYPDHLEAGTQNGPGIAGLAAGVRWVLDRGVDRLHAEETAHKRRLLEGLAGLEGVRVRSPARPDDIGIVTLVHEDLTAAEVARAVEKSHGVLGRAGLHCAPEAHQTIGTAEQGAFRLSIGWATSNQDIDSAIAALASLSGHGSRSVHPLNGR